MTKIKEIKLNITYRDMFFYNELLRKFFYDNINVFLSVIQTYLSCKRKEKWMENFLYFEIRLADFIIEIERTFQSDTESTLRYIQRDESKKVVLDLNNISKEEILERLKKFFEEIKSLKADNNERIDSKDETKP